MNAICERLVGTLRRELLDRLLILGEAHLRTVLADYQVHYNTARPHQGIAQRVPDGEHDGGRFVVADLDRGWIHRKPVLGGLINEYTRRLTPQRLAGHLTDPIFERDRVRLCRMTAAISLPGCLAALPCRLRSELLPGSAHNARAASGLRGCICVCVG
jgi:hypothetical protein